jgi:hypothetical protein
MLKGEGRGLGHTETVRANLDGWQLGIGFRRAE